MPESPSSVRESTSRASNRTDLDLELRSKATATTVDFRRYLNQNGSFRRPFQANLKSRRVSAKANPSNSSTVDRSGWWRVHLRVKFKVIRLSFISTAHFVFKDTPNPGAYETHLNTFVKEVFARPMTYGFKSDGRKRDPQPLEPKGKELLPGAYSYPDFAELSVRLLVIDLKMKTI